MHGPRLAGASCPFTAICSYRQPCHGLRCNIKPYSSDGEKSRTAISASECSAIRAEVRVVQNALKANPAVQPVGNPLGIPNNPFPSAHRDHLKIRFTIIFQERLSDFSIRRHSCKLGRHTVEKGIHSFVSTKIRHGVYEMLPPS
jgi:hypothetical protein